MIESMAGIRFGGIPIGNTAEMTAITDFLKDVFGSMTIGASGSLVELAVFDTAVREISTFADNQTRSSLMHSIDQLRLYHGRATNVDIHDLLTFLANQAFDGQSGDRRHVTNDVVIILDHSARESATLSASDRHMLQNIQGRIVFINIGQPSSDVINVSNSIFDLGILFYTLVHLCPPYVYTSILMRKKYL